MFQALSYYTRKDLMDVLNLLQGKCRTGYQNPAQGNQYLDHICTRIGLLKINEVGWSRSVQTNVNQTKTTHTCANKSFCSSKYFAAALASIVFPEPYQPEA